MFNFHTLTLAEGNRVTVILTTLTDCNKVGGVTLYVRKYVTPYLH